MSKSEEQPAEEAGVGSRLGISCFLSIFLIMGLIFSGFIAASFLEAAATYTWQKVPCSVTHSVGLVDDAKEDPYVWQVAFVYEVDGISYTGTMATAKGVRSDSFRKIQRRLVKLPAGAETFCYVNPDTPGEAYLERESLWMGLFIFLPLIFVLIGAGGIWGVWWGGKTKGTSAKAKPLSKQGRAGRRVSLIMGTLFAVIGGTVFFVWGGGLFYDYFTASSWQEVPCQVLHSRVLSRSSDDGTTYRVDIFYEYTVDGQTYRSNSYGLFNASSSGRAGKRRIVAQYPAGSEQTCYVKPGDPVVAVLNRSFSPIYLLVLIPFVFFLVGLALCTYGLKAPSTAGGGGTVFPSTSGRDGHRRDPMILKPKSGPLGRLFGMLVIMLFWNGIVSIFVWQVIEGFRTGKPSWFLAIFMTPFVLVGLALVGGLIYQLLALFNPTPQMRLTPGKLSLGESGQLEWRLRGRASRISTFSITLEGCEEATYQRGSNTCTDKETFFEQLLFETDQQQYMARGKVEITIPAEYMHSFVAPRNKIIWTIKVKGDIRRWPDIKEEFLIEVLA